MPELKPTDADTLWAFHRIAADVRSLLAEIGESAGDTRVVGGYLDTSDVLEAYRPLCIRVRRVCTESDRVSLLRTCKVVTEVGSEAHRNRATKIAACYQVSMKDLGASTTLNDRQVPHREVFEAWLDAATFGTFDASDSRYRSLFEECGKAVEGIAVRITESVAECIVQLDDLVAEVLE